MNHNRQKCIKYVSNWRFCLKKVEIKVYLMLFNFQKICEHFSNLLLRKVVFSRVGTIFVPVLMSEQQKGE